MYQIVKKKKAQPEQNAEYMYQLGHGALGIGHWALGIGNLEIFLFPIAITTLPRSQLPILNLIECDDDNGDVIVSTLFFCGFN